MQQHQRGFSAVEVIIIIVIVALLGLGGLLMWNKNKSDAPKDTSANTTPNAAQDLPATQNDSQPNGQQSAAQHLVIKEWNVRITLNDTNSDAYYVVKSDEPNYAYVSVKSLTNPECAPDKTSVGVFTRFKEGDRDPIYDMTYNELVPDAVKVGDYYYFYGHAQAYCDESQEAKLKAVSQAFTDNMKTVEAAN